MSTEGVRHMGKSYSSKEIIKILKAQGWTLKRIRGDHHQFQHPTHPGTVTIPHPTKDIDIKILKSIAKQAEIDL